MDNLVSHSAAALYETFRSEEAKRIWDHFEFVFTPKHGSWLNMAEIELNVLTKQCLNRRIDAIGTIKKEVTAWRNHRNNKKVKINWQFTTDDALCYMGYFTGLPLSRLYNTIRHLFFHSSLLG